MRTNQTIDKLDTTEERKAAGPDTISNLGRSKNRGSVLKPPLRGRPDRPRNTSCSSPSNKCRLQDLPDSIGGLRNLEKLSVSSNLVVSVPNSLGLLHNLKIFHASGKNLTVLPDSICRFK